MQLNMRVQAGEGGAEQQFTVRLDHAIVAGWSGRDVAAIEEHIKELEEIGIKRPSAVPLFYEIAANQLAQGSEIQVLGKHTSGEVETFVFEHSGQMYVSLASDHTDRQLEAYSVALSKQICVKPMASEAWRWVEVAPHWDQLILRSSILEGGQWVRYQEGSVASLRTPQDLIARRFNGGSLPDSYGMICGTVPTIGKIRPAARFKMEVEDPVLRRRIAHAYTIQELPIVE